MNQRLVVLTCVLSLLCSAEAQAFDDCQSGHLADGLQIALPLAALGVSAWHGNDTEGMWQFGLSFATTAASTQLLKYSVNSTRPCGGGHGFPSGHAALTFTSASYVQQRYGVAESIPFYALASLTAYDRVRTHHHRWGDVLGGAAIGIVSPLFFTEPKKETTVRMGMLPTDGGAAFFVSKTW